MTDRTVTACLIIIGNEILSGRTQDANLAYLAKRLNEEGVRLVEARVIPDEEARIVETVNEARARYDYVFTTGGIGPTHDDITSESVAKAFGRAYGEHPQARAILDAYYEPGQLNAARLRMACTPEGAELVENPISRAPGFQVENVFVLAGIPKVMQAMFESLRHRLAGGKPLISRSATVQAPEGRVARGLGRLQAAYPEVEMGSYPFSREGIFATRLVLRATDSARLDAAAEELVQLLGELDAPFTWDAAPE
jgi:molybdenum cofactor synthesis domain-containing protein